MRDIVARMGISSLLLSLLVAGCSNNTLHDVIPSNVVRLTVYNLSGKEVLDTKNSGTVSAVVKALKQARMERRTKLSGSEPVLVRLSLFTSNGGETRVVLYETNKILVIGTTQVGKVDTARIIEQIEHAEKTKMAD